MRVDLSPRAAKQLDKLNRNPKLQDRIIAAIEGLGQDPFSGKVLYGDLQGFRSLRVGNWRIVYNIGLDILLIVKIEKRDGVYR